jgi:hypothetical protein
MTQTEKAELYDLYIRQGDVYLRENSKLKSEYPIDMPNDKQKIIDSNNNKVNELQVKLQNLFK